MLETKEYKKLNSFEDLNIKDVINDVDFLNSIKKKLELEKNLKKLNTDQKKILKKVKTDLFDETSKNEIKFNLSKHVKEEIKTLDDDEISLYLVHRYRYEVYPQLNILDDYPPYLQIEPSSICNFRCIFCFETDRSFTDKKQGFMGTMKLDLFKEIIDQAENNIEFLSIASRGEPLVCKEIVQMLKYTEGKFLNLKLNTNASLLNEKSCHAILGGGVKTVVFSADAADEKLYSKLRVNGDLKKVLKNIELFKKIKDSHYSESKIITRVSGVKVNDEQNINSMVKLWGNLVDQVAFVDYNPWENVYESKKNKIKKPCSDLWRRMFIWWDGKANPCDTDYKSVLSPGNFKKLDIKGLWNSPNYNELRKIHINQSREKLHPCSNCVVV